MAASTESAAPASDEARACLEEVLSPEELVSLGSGRVPLVSTLISVLKCEAQIGALGASFPLSVDQLECLQKYAGDDVFQALATTTEPPEHIAAALEACAIDLAQLTEP